MRAADAGATNDDGKETEAIGSFVRSWSEAVADRAVDSLEKMYAAELIAYGRPFTRRAAIGQKRALFKSDPSFNQRISALRVERIADALWSARFEKTAKVKGIESMFPSYLVIAVGKAGPAIVAEGDERTDAALGAARLELRAATDDFDGAITLFRTKAGAPVTWNAFAESTVTLLSSHGEALDQRRFDGVPIALRRLVFQPGNAAVVAVTVDNYAGMGSYSGQFTYFMRTQNGKLVDVLRLSEESKLGPLVLANTLKNRWSLDGPRPNALLEVSTMPREAVAGFGLVAPAGSPHVDVFSTYTWDGSRFARKSKLGNGTFSVEESDEFPKRAAFP